MAAGRANVINPRVDLSGLTIGADKSSIAYQRPNAEIHCQKHWACSIQNSSKGLHKRALFPLFHPT